MMAEEFKNEDHLPVESLTMTIKHAGLVRVVQAIDPHWADQKHFIFYERPPSGSCTVLGAKDIWKIKMDWYLDELKWLLSLDYHRFWSTVLYNSNCMDMLVSFLQEANPPYMPQYEGRDVKTLYQDIRRMVLVVFCRLVTNKESKSKWMSKDYLRDAIYNKFIFTVPILWDICLVYGSDNPHTVSRLLESVFALQPKYLTDLDAAIAFVKEALKYIILQVNKDFEAEEPPNLPATFQGFSTIRRPSATAAKDEKLTVDSLRDLVVHLMDTALTLRIFVEIYPKAADVYRRRGLVLSIVQVYEHAIPALYEKLEELACSREVNAELHTLLEATRVELIDIFREVLARPKNAIFSGNGKIESHVEAYLSLLMDGLSEKLLIQDYHACYPVNDDLEMLKQAYPSIDPVKTDFILQAIYSNLDDPVPELSHQPSPNGHFETKDNTDMPATTTDNEIPTNIREESLITEVKDIFPDLGDGFVLKCLQHYGFNSERVISSILEDNLDPGLRNIDRSLPIIPEDPLDKKFLETGIERLNVFDGDQFDIMTRDDVDLSKIHTGKKKSKYKDLNDMLDDKTEVKKMADIYTKYTLVCSDEALYSDEYDDTYDDERVDGARGDEFADDLGKPFTTPRVLAGNRRHEESSSESEAEEPSTSSQASRSKLDFCSNPEEMRARREANYRLKMGKGRAVPPPRNTDVVGKAKGQGQEKEVVVNRDKKEKSKSSRANHNRRSGAAWKRNQGLMPS